jgi:hypothetical protein
MVNNLFIIIFNVMKTFLFAATILILFSCKKENIYWGIAEATKNQTQWEARPVGGTAQAYPDGFIGINADVFNSDGFKRENLFFERVPLEAGTYPLGIIVYPATYSHVGSAYFTYVSDGDASEDHYAIDTTAVDNHFEVLSFNENKKEIEVKFTASYIISRRVNPNTPEKIKFEDGYIKTRIYK